MHRGGSSALPNTEHCTPTTTHRRAQPRTISTCPPTQREQTPTHRTSLFARLPHSTVPSDVERTPRTRGSLQADAADYVLQSGELAMQPWGDARYWYHQRGAGRLLFLSKAQDGHDLLARKVLAQRRVLVLGLSVRPANNPRGAASKPVGPFRARAPAETRRKRLRAARTGAHLPAPSTFCSLSHRARLLASHRQQGAVCACNRRERQRPRRRCPAVHSFGCVKTLGNGKAGGVRLARAPPPNDVTITMRRPCCTHLSSGSNKICQGARHSD
eukprot:56967-Prymnesium_polylepis.1